MSSNLADDESIDNNEILWRRFPLRQGYFKDWYKQDENGNWHPTSIAFLDNRSRTHSLSAYIASETDLNRLRTDYPNDNIASFPASVPLKFNHTIKRVPDKGYDSHVEITPPSDTWGHEQRFRNKRKPAAREMAKAAQWVYFRDTES